ncbi:MAG: RHS repeat-associated core domain-containing protein [Pyrinomonadaceae bacterium]
MKECNGDTGTFSFEQIFEFDNFGNLYRKSASNPGSGEDPIAFEPIENTDIDKSTNRFSSASGVSYDNAGRVVSDDKFRDADFLYDANGRMVRTARSGVPDAETVYDGFGNRVLTKVQGVWELALYDAFGRLSVEYGGSTQMDEGGVRYVHQDHQGSVRTVTNAAGFVAARRDYQPFGETIQAGVGLRTGAQGYEGGVGARQGYGLTEGDEASGLAHTWFRKLDAAAGRWTGPDPYNGSASVIEPDSWNRYSYVENEPTNFVDPTGLLLVQRCRKYWWYDSNGVYHQQIRDCVTLYDDSTQGEQSPGGGAAPDKPRINSDILKDCVSEIFGEEIAGQFDFIEPSNGKNGRVILNIFNEVHGVFDLDTSSFSSEEINQLVIDPGILSDRLLELDQSPIRSYVGFMGMAHNGVGVIYFNNAIVGAGLPFNQVAAIEALLQWYTNSDARGLLSCMARNNGIDFS